MARNGALLNHDAMTSVAAHAPLFVPAAGAGAQTPPANGASTHHGQFAATLYLKKWIAGQTGPVTNIADTNARNISLPDTSCGIVLHDAPLTADAFDTTVETMVRTMRQDGVAVLAAELGHNPFARRNRSRRLVGTNPASFQICEPLTCRHLDSLRASFGSVNVHAFDLLTMPLARLHAAFANLHPGLTRLTAPFWPLLRAADRFLLRWRPLRRYAGQVVVLMKWPRRHDRD